MSRRRHAPTEPGPSAPDGYDFEFVVERTVQRVYRGRFPVHGADGSEVQPHHAADRLALLARAVGEDAFGAVGFAEVPELGHDLLIKTVRFHPVEKP